MHRVIALAGEVHLALVIPTSLVAGEDGGTGDLVARRSGGTRRVGHHTPRDAAIGVDDARLQNTRRQFGIRGGRVTVEAAFAVVLGHVHGFVHGVHRGGLVRPQSHGRVRHGFLGTGRIALPDTAGAGEILLATQPGTPRRRATRAVGVAALENAIRVEDLTIGTEVNGRHAAGRGCHELEHLAVAHVVVTALAIVERGGAIGERVPVVVGVAHRIATDRDDARGEPGRQQQSVFIGCVRQRTVRAFAGHGHVATTRTRREHRTRNGGTGTSGQNARTQKMTTIHDSPFSPPKAMRRI
ncbi:unannotated protein [freshwater metagenome]|uniref:Unannotated protein n=1 Tax=freshwater metagenome TaxID=449393 RepID=A0A6J6EVD2_9ZZZZ